MAVRKITTVKEDNRLEVELTRKSKGKHSVYISLNSRVFSVDFVDNKATVTKEVAEMLKLHKIIK